MHTLKLLLSHPQRCVASNAVAGSMICAMVKFRTCRRADGDDMLRSSIVVYIYEHEFCASSCELRPLGHARISKPTYRVLYEHSRTLDDAVVTLVMSERGSGAHKAGIVPQVTTN